MILLNKKSSKCILVISTVFLLLSCSTSTKLSLSWADPENKKSYNDLLIIGIFASEHNRRAYESYFVEELRVNNTEAEASFRLIKSNETIERDTVQKAIKGMDIDGVIMTHLISVDEETSYRSGASHVYAGYGVYGRGMYGYYPFVSSYVHSPGYYTTHRTYSLETRLYDIETEDLVWTARSRTVSPESTKEVIVDLTKLLINDLKEKNLIKNK